MKKALFFGTVMCTIMTFAACKSKTANELPSKPADTNELSWEVIDDKMADGIPLSESDRLFILTDTTLDDGHSEGVGYHLFCLLHGNPQDNELFLNVLKGFPKEKSDEYLRGLMDLMSIDIAEEGYEQYEDFLSDFPMFSNCAGAEEQLNEIKENQL